MYFWAQGSSKNIQKDILTCNVAENGIEWNTQKIYVNWRSTWCMSYNFPWWCSHGRVWLIWSMSERNFGWWWVSWQLLWPKDLSFNRILSIWHSLWYIYFKATWIHDLLQSQEGKVMGVCKAWPTKLNQYPQNRIIIFKKYFKFSKNWIKNTSKPKLLLETESLQPKNFFSEVTFHTWHSKLEILQFSKIINQQSSFSP